MPSLVPQAGQPPYAPFSPRQALFCGALTLLVDIAISSPSLGTVARGALLNPDSYMRLARLDAILAAAAPIDAVARDASGSGTILHWSHLLDSVLLVLAAPLAPFLGAHEAMFWAGVALGPLSAAALGIALAWAAAPLSEPAWRWTAALIGTVALPIFGYAVPGVVHHHILVALAAVIGAGWAGRVGIVGPASGWHLGAWAGFGLWLSPEAMPVALMAFGSLGIAWLCHPGDPRWGTALAGATTLLCLLAMLAFAVDPPAAAPMAPDVLRLSIVYVTMALFGAALGWCLWLLDRLRLPPLRRGLCGAALTTIAGAGWLALFPAVLSSPQQVLDGQHRNALTDIAEMQPLRTIADVALYLWYGIFAAIVASILAVRGRSPQFAYVTACILAIVLAAAVHRRFSTYAACVGAIAVPAAITLINRCLTSRPPALAASARLTLLLGLLFIPFLPQLFITRSTPPPTCSLLRIVPDLLAFAGRTVLADVNDTPELLYRTELRTVGSLYRNVAAYLRLRDAWRGRPPDDRSAVAATGATLILFCRHSQRSPMVSGLPADTLWDRLGRDEVPAWLQEIPLDPASGFRLFRLQ